MTYNIPIVFSTDDDPPWPLGRYDRTDEETVVYHDSAGDERYAPADCVKIIRVTVNVP